MYITVPADPKKILPALYVEDFECNGRQYRYEWETTGTHILVTGNPVDGKPGVQVAIHPGTLNVSTYEIAENGARVYSEEVVIVKRRTADLENANLKAVVDCALTKVNAAMEAAPDKPTPVEPDLTDAF